MFLFVMLRLRVHLSLEPRSESLLVFANSLEDGFQTEGAWVLYRMEYSALLRMYISIIFVAAEFPVYIAGPMNDFGNPQ